MRLRATRISTGIRPIQKGLAVLVAAMFASAVAAGIPTFRYEASDMSSMYQDFNGLTPVTAVEQPVGLMLDKSLGLIRGPQLVTTPNINGVAIGGPGITAYSTGAPLVAGKWYEFSATVSGFSGSSDLGFVAAAFATAGGGTRLSSNGVLTGIRQAVTTGVADVFTRDVNTANFTNISIRELPGNHLTQATTTARPVLSSRVNLLTYSEQFDNAAWLKDAGGTITANNQTAPDGTMTADTLTVTASNAMRQSIAKPANDVVYSARIWLKKLTGSGVASVRFVSNGSIIAPSVVTPDLSSGNWVEVKTTGSSGAFTDLRLDVVSQGAGDTFAVWGADIRLGGLTQLGRYQRIAAATVYDVTGFPSYLRFDGIDDCLFTPITVNLTSTDKLSVFVGLQKNSDAARGVVVETGTNFGDVGAFGIGAPWTAGVGDVLAGTTGTSPAPRQIVVSGYPSPAKLVLSALYDLGNPSPIVFRVNGASSTGTASTGGNYGNYQMYVGRRNNTSLQANIQLYSLHGLGRIESPDNVWFEERYAESLMT